MKVHRGRTLTIGAVGDCIITRRISVLSDPHFRKLVNLLRRSDCAYGNCEVVLVDHWRGHPSAKANVDPPIFCEPFGADELAWLGLKLMGLANNHIMDYGSEGLKSTIENLNRVGIANTGAGMTLGQASLPAYCETQNGRVAVVNCSSSFPEAALSTEGRSDCNGRPGVNGLRIERTYCVDPTHLAQFRSLLSEFLRVSGFTSFEADEMSDHMLISSALGICGWVNTRFVNGDIGRSMTLASSVNEDDGRRFTEGVAIAKRNADIVLATCHAHEYHGSEETPDLFQQQFAHQCIDAGADAFIASGPHILRGIEVYRDKPIFYSLGNFLAQIGTVKAWPADVYSKLGFQADAPDPSSIYDEFAFNKQESFWESLVAQITYKSGRLTGITLNPIELGADKPRFAQGTPMLTRADQGNRIIDRISKLSQPFGTTIHFEGGVGSVRIDT
jgi:poly-gamma-glutamate capsule biosynthesis protein CapA/YwtB (metallophosphatase superfamily)